MQQVKATKQIIDWDAEAGQSVIINIGDTGELSAAMLENHKGSYELIADKPQLDHDGDGKAGGSTSGGSGDEMAALRDEYENVVGKRPFNGWDAEELRRRMDEALAAKAGDEDEGEAPAGDSADSGDDAAEDAAGPPA